MYSLDDRNAGVDFLIENMAKDTFQQTILGFNCVTRLEYSAAEGHICVFFESDNFGSWMDATSGNLEAKLGEEFGDSLENLDDRGFALKIPTPEGITESIKDSVSTLRDKVYCLTFTSMIEQAEILSKGFKYTDGTPVQINKRVTLYLYKVKDGIGGTFVFVEPDNAMEKELYQVFLSAFQETRRKREFSAAPSLSYRKQNDFDTLEINFLASHQQDLAKCSRMLYAIPDNLDYHIKAAKTFFHHNMHSKCKEWLQTLNEADPEKNDGHAKGKKKSARKSIR